MVCPPAVAAGWESLPPASAYSPPELLLALHILDLLELCGSQNRAARALQLHQSTVSRVAASISDQFDLRPPPPGGLIRYGNNDCLRLLRLAARAHRRMQGVLRIGMDPLHQPLLAGLAAVLPLPPLFRPADHWAELIDQALLEGAIVSSWCHAGPLQADAEPRWPRLVAVPLGCLPLQLVCPRAAQQPDLPPTAVLLPRRGVAPVLHELFLQEGFRVEVQPQSCQEPAAWLKRLRDRRLAMPLCPPLLDPHWFQRQQLIVHSAQPHLQQRLPERLWLLLSEELWGSSAADRCPLAQQLVQALRQRLADALRAGASAAA